MQIPFHKPYVTEDEINAVADSMRKGWLTMAGKTEIFEERFKDFIGSSEAVAVNSCTAALHLALKCIDLKKGDEVIIPAMTHTSTAEAIGYFEAKPVMIDIERGTHLLDASGIEKKISNRTKAIIPVHYGGQPADMKEIIGIAERYKLFVIEDAAHAFPSRYNGRYIGTIGDATCFSFYATKPLTTGEGGMITTENPEWAQRMKKFRLHGVSRDAWSRDGSENFWEYNVMEPGYKYNTTDINSAIGIEQLKKADILQEMRSKIADKYNQAFKSCENFILYDIKDNRDTSWHLYPLKLNLESLSIDRNRFVNELKARGIMTSVHFIPLYRFSYYRTLGYSVNDYPDSEWVFERILSLPIYPGMTDQEIDYVIENVLGIIDKFKR